MVTAHDHMVRRNTRFDVALPAKLAVGNDHGAIVRFSATSGHHGGWVDASVVDVGTGGLGLITGTFVPRRTVCRVRVLEIADPSMPPLLECVVRVQRVIMTDRRPAYLLGTAFERTTAETDAAIDAFLSKLSGQTGNPQR